MRNDRTTADEDDPDGFNYDYLPNAGTFPLGWPGRSGTERADKTYDDEPYEDRESVQATGNGNESWWDEGLISLLLLAGVVLFVIPEPATSGLGILLIGVGVVLWILDWAT